MAFFASIYGLDREETEKKIRQLLELVKLTEKKEAYVDSLSRGMKQRLCLARCMIHDPKLLILDEPASGIDFKGGMVCCELLDRFRKERNFTQLMITHDLSTVLAHATHVICLNKRIVAEGDPMTILTPEVLAETFGPHKGIPAPGTIPATGCSCKGKH